MRLYPAIDVKDGQCVRLKKGLFNEVTVYSERPYEIAKGFEEAGAQFIHTVDLDGHKTILCINTYNNMFSTESVNGSLNKIRILNSLSTDNNSVYAEIKNLLNVFKSTDSTAHLYRNINA